ncbi:peroxidase-like [Myzus persicae]|uniref:peroxidase-like n=1 Tax=Myzus persicae TaxID=13164 RepID=UPI000B936E81|nr:peroxidase-like [Myzus persicae]XP_022170861.1 peroxidase-like [Myzus persicae]
MWRNFPAMNNLLILVFLDTLLTYSGIQAQTYPEANLIKNVSDEFYKKCATSVTCNSTSKYRTINGTCNNLEQPLWGSTFTPYIRLGSAYYDDGNYSLRLQYKNKSELPGARHLQLELFWPRTFPIDVPDISRNYHVNQVGQFITHDISLMGVNFTVPPADCCAVQSDDNIPDICQAVIKIPPQDPAYSEINKTCLPFRRAMTASFDFNCEITPQIPVNQQTAFLDASQIYGSTVAKADSLRSHDLGKLKTDMIDGQEFCPQKQRNGSFCDGRTNVTYCFDGGDPRGNQHFGLILYQVAFVRFHNLIAGLLLAQNPNWSDEILYQEARKFITAVLQILVYRDYLPVLLGSDYCEKVGLTLTVDKKTVYDPSIMPQLAVEFSGGCFRVPHNVVPSLYYFVDETYHSSENFKLNEYMSFPDPIIGGSKLEELLRGMSFVKGRCPLPNYNLLISSGMFHNFISTVADTDLLSIDIQRGRDIGLPPYIRVRKICGFPNITSFDDLSGALQLTDIELLKQNYESVEDIDLLVGALLEPLVDDAMVGETARCIISDGFFRIRYGDRFFFDVEDQPGSFSKEQYDVLWSLTLSQIFCATTEIDILPFNIFIPARLTIDCGSTSFNLSAWKEN